MVSRHGAVRQHFLPSWHLAQRDWGAVGLLAVGRWNEAKDARLGRVAQNRAPGRIAGLIENPFSRDPEPEGRRATPLLVNLDLIALTIPPDLRGAAIGD